jgi:hypothetical protein
MFRILLVAFDDENGRKNYDSRVTRGNKSQLYARAVGLLAYRDATRAAKGDQMTKVRTED